MPPLRRVLEQMHAAAWRLGLDVLPVPPESRALTGMQQEDVFRLQGVLQRALGQQPGKDDVALPEWTPLVAEALQLADQGLIPRSQLLQDVWVLRATGRATPGFFVEIGAGDGRFLSNSYLLETSFGWRGVLCEPNPKFAADIRSLDRPRAILLEHAVSALSGQTVLLTDCAERSSVTSASGRRPATPVTTIAPTDVLERADAPEVIDYLSVDTEGSEPMILRAWPWSKHHVRFISVEHNYVRGRLQELDAILVPQGFRRVMHSWSGVDGWYSHHTEEGRGAA